MHVVKAENNQSYPVTQYVKESCHVPVSKCSVRLRWQGCFLVSCLITAHTSIDVYVFLRKLL